jgi:hypothetical protein
MGITVNSSISNSDARWKRFAIILISSFIGLFVAGYVFILIVDPYGMLPLSFDFDRGPITAEQRYFFPNLAKKSQFDSAIIGTSTIRLLNPDDLNPLLKSNFVNLAMNAASVFEQEAIFNVFLRYHRDPKTVIFDVDDAYFDKNNYTKHIGGVRPEHFPEWMYDENPFNDLLPYNWRTMQITIKQLKCITGMRPYKFRLDGYEDYTKTMFSHDIDHIRKIIYGSKTPKKKKPLEPPVQATPELIKSFEFPAIRHLDRMLNRLPESTLKIVIIPPFHVYHQATPGSEDAVKWKVFKYRIANLVCRYQNAMLLDFMIESPITTRDENYFDQIHYTVAVAKEISRWIAQESISQADNPNFNRYCNRMTASFKR